MPELKQMIASYLRLYNLTMLLAWTYLFYVTLTEIVTRSFSYATSPNQCSLFDSPVGILNWASHVLRDTFQYEQGTSSGASWFAKLANAKTNGPCISAADMHVDIIPMTSKLLLVSFLELAHTILGMSKGSVLSTFIQLFGRLTVWQVILGFDESCVLATNALPTLILCWSYADMCRFPYYIMHSGTSKKTTKTQSTNNANLNKRSWSQFVYEISKEWTLYLRYSAFIPLYPLGFLAEMICILIAINGACVSPQRFFFGNSAILFSLYKFIFLPIAYGLCAPYLYLHMLKSRKRKLSNLKFLVLRRQKQKKA